MASLWMGGESHLNDCDGHQLYEMKRDRRGGAIAAGAHLKFILLQHMQSCEKG